MLRISHQTQRWMFNEYSKQHRHYHTYSHVTHVLDTLRAAKDKFSNIQAAEFAAFFHDIVYEVGEEYKNNEQRSGTEFLIRIGKDNPGLRFESSDPDFGTVKLALIMIECTSSHTVEHLVKQQMLSEAELEDVKMFLDADIKILSESYETVLSFERAIRKEFSVYDNETYRAGRLQVLNSFLERPSVYMSELGKKWENDARNNLHLLIKSLQYQKG